MLRQTLVAIGTILVLATAARAEDTTVFAAASLTNAFQDVAKLYVATGKPEPKFSFAASSALAKQIEQGAPAAIFASADEPWMDYLAKKDLIVADSRTSFLGNDLVLIAPTGSATDKVDMAKGVDLAALLGPDGKIATGDPASVPVGKYAKEALTNLGVWDALAPRIAAAENVRAALALVERGEAPLGIVYATDAAVAKGVKEVGTFPANSHTPITYPIALLKGHDDAANRALLAFLTGPEANAVYKKYGFVTKGVVTN